MKPFFYNRFMTGCRGLSALLLIAVSAPALAQGEDGTRAERNLQVIAEMLPGRFDNANQAYFDRRLNEPEEKRHQRYHGIIARTKAAEIGPYVFSASIASQNEDGVKEDYLYALAPEQDGWSVRMKIYAAAKNNDAASKSYLKGCDILWLEEAGQFRAAAADDGCKAGTGALVAREMLLSEDALWMKFRGDERRHYTMERARNFSCYLDVPGVGGGRDIPYKRYQIPNIHDRGDEVWTKLDDGSEISIRLQNIRWPMNNLKNIFTRHSFVIYINQREGDEVKEVTYAWAAPNSQRIGVNLKWMLVNCFMINNENVTPFFKKEPRL